MIDESTSDEQRKKGKEKQEKVQMIKEVAGRMKRKRAVNKTNIKMPFRRIRAREREEQTFKEHSYT